MFDAKARVSSVGNWKEQIVVVAWSLITTISWLLGVVLVNAKLANLTVTLGRRYSEALLNDDEKLAEQIRKCMAVTDSMNVRWRFFSLSLEPAHLAQFVGVVTAVTSAALKFNSP